MGEENTDFQTRIKQILNESVLRSICLNSLGARSKKIPTDPYIFSWLNEKNLLENKKNALLKNWVNSLLPELS